MFESGIRRGQALHCPVHQWAQGPRIRHRHQEHVRVLGLGWRPLLTLVSQLFIRQLRTLRILVKDAIDLQGRTPDDLLLYHNLL